MANLPESLPPDIEKVRASPSRSVAVTVVTAVVFSATEIDAVVPPPFDVITGGSSTVTITLRSVNP